MHIPWFVIVGLAVLAVIFVVTAIGRLFRKAGPHEALVVPRFE